MFEGLLRNKSARTRLSGTETGVASINKKNHLVHLVLIHGRPPVTFKAFSMVRQLKGSPSAAQGTVMFRVLATSHKHSDERSQSFCSSE